MSWDQQPLPDMLDYALVLVVPPGALQRLPPSRPDVLPFIVVRIVRDGTESLTGLARELRAMQHLHQR